MHYDHGMRGEAHASAKARIIAFWRIMAFPINLSLGIPFPSDKSLGKVRWGTLARDTFPSDMVGPTYFSVKQLVPPWHTFPSDMSLGNLKLKINSPRAPSTPSYSAGHSTPPNYSSGPSTPTNYSLGSLRNGECSDCKHLRGKISVLKATMDMHMHPEQHTVNSAAIFHEVLNEMEKLDFEKFVMCNVIRMIWSSLSFAM
ncbi:hypothetical protein Tco_0969117 [Tanacetum coccineum]